jgi:hypothetical protein
MPKKLMQDIEQGALELESGTIDMEDIDQAYQTGADDETTDQGDVVAQQAQQPAPAGQPLGAPGA